MEADAIKEIVQLARQDLAVSIDGQTFTATQVYDPRKPDPDAEPLLVRSLQALIDLVSAGNHMELSESETVDIYQPALCVVHVETPTIVRLLSRVYGRFKQRDCHAVASAKDLGAGYLGGFQPQDQFVLGLLTRFTSEGDRDELMKLAGNVTNEQIRTEADDGVTQELTVRSGVTLLDHVKVPGSWMLSPFRTFREVEQPQSPFAFRAKNTGVGVQLALLESDGGAWELDAVRAVAEWLGERLPDHEILA